MSCGKYLSRGWSFASVSQARKELTPPFLFLCLPVWWNWQRTYWNSWWTWCSRWCAMASSALPVFSEKTSWTKWSRRSYCATLTLLSHWPREASLPGTTQALRLHIFIQHCSWKNMMLKVSESFGSFHSLRSGELICICVLTGQEHSTTSAVMRLQISSLSWTPSSSIRSR